MGVSFYMSVVWYAEVHVCDFSCICLWALCMNLCVYILCWKLYSQHVLKRSISRCSKSPWYLFHSAKISRRCKKTTLIKSPTFFSTLSSVYRQITLFSSFQWFVRTIISSSVPLALPMLEFMCTGLFNVLMFLLNKQYSYVSHWSKLTHSDCITRIRLNSCITSRIMRSQEPKWQSGLQQKLRWNICSFSTKETGLFKTTCQGVQLSWD